jgi:hypothetical protein
MAISKAFDILLTGIRIRFCPGFPKRLLWRSRKFKPGGNPALTVVCVENLKKIKRTKSLLKCADFWLDVETRTLFYPQNTSRLFAVKRRGTIHNLLQRSIVFALAMLHEINDAESILGQPVVLYLHASSVATKKGALVFCGESTFGKTTISGKLLSDFPKLEDDQALLFMWPGTSRPPAIALLADDLKKLTKKCRFPARDGTVPIAGLFWLKKGPVFSLEPMSTAEAAAGIVYPVALWRRRKAVENHTIYVINLLKCIPMKRLQFRKESKPLIELLKLNAYI